MTTTYDGDGRAVATQTPAGLITSVNYDSVGRPIDSTDPTGAVTTATYSPRGELLTQTDPTGGTIGYSFDAVGQVTDVVNANGGTTSYGYDGTGSRTSRTSALGDAESWTYDASDRPLSVTDQNGDTATTSHDSVGRLVSSTDASGRTMTLSYDAAGRVSDVVYSDGVDSYAVTYGYDAAGRRTSMVDPDGTWAWTYDSRNRVTQVVEPDGTTIGYGYDANGNRTSMTYPDGTVVTYGYDALNRLTSVDHPGFGETTYTYDADGRPLSESLPDGNSRSWSYTDGRMTSFADSQTGSSTVTYDAAGRIVGTAGAENWTFDYDVAGQLVFAQLDGRTWDYGYDADGNLVMVDDSVDGVTTYTVDAASRLTGGSDPDGPLAFAYDASGRLLSSTTGDGTATTWSYDVRGLPTEIVSSADPCVSATPTMVGTPGDDVLVGTPGDDVIFGLGGNDTIEGLAGNDVLCGGDGNDSIVGNEDADVISGGPGDDVIGGGKGNDVIYGGDGADEVEGKRGADQIFGGPGDDDLAGNEDDDVVWGGPGNDDIGGGKGNDVLHGGDGDDHLDGKTGNDTLDGNAGVNTLTGRQGNDSCDDGTATGSCETFTSQGMANDVVEPVVSGSVQSRGYDGLGSLVSVDIDGETTDLVWDHNRGIPQIVTLTDADGPADQVYGLTRLAELTTAGAERYGYTVLGDTSGLGTGFDPFGNPLAEATDSIGFGYRTELHIGNQVHLRARDLVPSIGRFISVDPLDGVAGTVVETNSFHYANNDPINSLDPLGLRPRDVAFSSVTLEESLDVSGLGLATAHVRGVDLSAIYAWRFMAQGEEYLRGLAGGDCAWWALFGCGVDPLALPGLFAGESAPGGRLDPKPMLREYLTGPNAPYGGRLLVDLGDPEYLFYFDVLGNAMWGSIVQRWIALPDGPIEWLVNNVPGAGETDEGDDIILRAGLQAGRRYDEALTLGQIVTAIRNTRDELVASYGRENLSDLEDVYERSKLYRREWLDAS